MDQYLIAYAIVDAATNTACGTGSTTWPLRAVPGTPADVTDLAAQITSAQHSNGTLPTSYRLNVLSWSKMGG